MLVVTAACGTASSGRGAASNGEHAPSSGGRAVLVSTQPVVFVPSTIDFTGKTDVTNALQTLIDNADDGVIIRFHKNGRYRVEGTLFVTNKTSITFDGQNATIFATTRGTLERSQWWITDGGGLIFRNFIVHGANPYAGLADKAYDPRYEKQHGFRIEGVDGIELSHVTVTDVYGDFVYVARYVTDTPTNIWIHDSKFARNGRQGISLIAANGVIIERNSFSDTRRGTIDLEPNGPNQSVENVFILNNTIGTGRLFFIASHGKGPVSDIVVSGNQLHKHVLSIDVVPPKNERRKNWIITNNTSDTSSSQRPIRFIDVDGLQVTGNKQPVSGTLPGVEITDVCGATVTNNVFGKTQLLSHGATCSAVLTVPTQPAISGRS
jgi:Right handed beta helix region